MGTITRGTTYGSTETITNAKLHILVDDATVTGIVNADVSAGAAIDSSKINLTSSGYVTSGANTTFTGDLTSSGGFNLTSTSLTDVLGLIYPVGIVITLGVATNPATLLGIGTWTAITGKVIVGKAGSGTFNTLDATGGAETHTHADGSYAVNIGITTSGANSTNQKLSNVGGSGTPDVALNGHTHTVDPASTDVSGTSAAGSSLQPYIVKYVWQRTS